MTLSPFVKFTFPLIKFREMSKLVESRYAFCGFLFQNKQDYLTKNLHLFGDLNNRLNGTA